MTSRQMKRGSSAPQRQSNVRQSNYKRGVGGRIDAVCQLMLLQGVFFFFSSFERLTSSYSLLAKLGQYLVRRRVVVVVIVVMQADKRQADKRRAE